jgi:hypothetical protein
MFWQQWQAQFVSSTRTLAIQTVCLTPVKIWDNQLRRVMASPAQDQTQTTVAAAPSTPSVTVMETAHVFQAGTTLTKTTLIMTLSMDVQHLSVDALLNVQPAPVKLFVIRVL